MSRENKLHYERSFYKILYTARAFEIFTKLYRFLGRSFYLAICKLVAWGYAITQRGVCEVVRDNLQLLVNRPVSYAEATRVFVNYGATIADYVAIGAMPHEQAIKLCTLIGGREPLENAKNNKRGIILATGHFGFFEYGALFLGSMGYPVTVVTFPEPSPDLTAWRASYRRQWGVETIEIGEDPFSAFQIVQAIGKGKFIAMLIDRPMGLKNMLIELPGGSIPISISPAVMAWTTGCTVLPVVIRRTSLDTYEILQKSCIQINRAMSRNDAIRLFTQQIAESLFEEICKTPDQWYQFVPVKARATAALLL